jgi:hypothetical protein
MLIKAGNVIFNAERIIKAEYREKDDKKSLSVHLAGGDKDATYTTLDFVDNDAHAVWIALSNEAQGVPGVQYQPA